MVTAKPWPGAQEISISHRILGGLKLPHTVMSGHMESLSHAQIHYMQTVLGIDHVLIPQASHEAVAAVSKWRSRGDHAQAKFTLLVCSDDHEFPLLAEADQLLGKMLQAMKVSLSEVAIVEWTQAQTAPLSADVQSSVKTSRSVLVMGENAARSLGVAKIPFGEFFPWNESRLFLTYSPNDLLLKPELKKNAWAHLQVFMKQI